MLVVSTLPVALSSSGFFRSSSSSNIPLHMTRTIKGAATSLISIPYTGKSFPFLIPGAATAAIKGSAN